MKGQRLYHVDLSDGGHDARSLDDAPHFVSPLEVALREGESSTVLGAGPLAGTPVPGASDLLIVGRSPGWRGLYPATIPGAALSFDGVFSGPLVLRERAPTPSVLVIERGKRRIALRVEPLDPAPAWAEGGAPELLRLVVERYGATLASVRAIACGPAAASTPWGALLSAPVEDGALGPARSTTTVGGLGSTLYQAHGLCAIVFGGGRSDGELLRRGGPPVLGTFGEGLSREQLEKLAEVAFDPLLLRGGSLLSRSAALAHDGLWLNGRSAGWPVDRRQAFYRDWQAHGVLPLVAALDESGSHVDPGAPCGLYATKVLADGAVLDFERYAALGPQLGVLDADSVRRLVQRSERLGLEARALAAPLGWLMESLQGGAVKPGQVGLDERPRWSFAGGDVIADSQHNAALVERLLDGLASGASWAAPFGEGVARGAEALGADASTALVLGNAAGGELAPLPSFSVAAVAPVPIATEEHARGSRSFLAPRELGRACAERTSTTLMLLDLGLSPLHHVWGEALLPRLIDVVYRRNRDWPQHHRKLVAKLHRARPPRFWSARVVELVVARLQSWRWEQGADPALDFWVRRCVTDEHSAARAFWTELLAGVSDGLQR